MTTRQWAEERLSNTARIAETKTGSDRDGWIDDFNHWRQIVAALNTLDETKRYVERCQAHNTHLVARHEVELAHARKQAEADGFQIGWHAALTRVWAGDRVYVLRRLVPKPPIQPCNLEEIQVPIPEDTQ